jgi:branched-chain amino acid transport system substrate-binding protein
MRHSSVIRSSAILSAALCALLAQPASAAVIGVVAPTSGPYARLGEQIQHGASAAVGDGNQIVVVPETCEPGSGKQVAEQLKTQGVSIAIGFLCVETLTDALPLLKRTGIPAITVSVRSRILSEDAQRQGWSFFRLAPAEGQEAAALSDIILGRWQNQPIALIDDGTIYARDLIAAVRSRIEAGGIKPVFVDTFRPGQEQQLSLVRRLAKAGATRVIVGGDRTDIAVMARDAEKDGAKLTFVGGDVMRAANRPVSLPEGVMAVALPDFSKEVDADGAVSILRVAGVDPDGYTLPAYAAVQVAEQALNAAQTHALSLTDALRQETVQSAIGPVAFQSNGELKQNLFTLQTWRQNGWSMEQTPTE